MVNQYYKYYKYNTLSLYYKFYNTIIKVLNNKLKIIVLYYNIYFEQ